MPTTSRDDQYLFGIFAVQLGQITPEKLAEFAPAWQSSASIDLGTFLLDRGAIDERSHRLIAGFVDSVIREFGGDASAALNAFGGREQAGDAFGGSTDQTEIGEAQTVPMQRSAAGEFAGLGAQGVMESAGRYTVRSEYARGGMGRVLLVHDEFLDREVALKEMLPEIAGDRGASDEDSSLRKRTPMVSRFLREAKITGQLEHPSIVPVYELGERADGSLYYTMKLVRGKTLSTAIEDARNLEGRLRLLSHFLDLCNAIAYAHSRQIIHRDLKPGNVMVGEFGETVVLDWGIAGAKREPGEVNSDPAGAATPRKIRNESTTGGTKHGEAIGTPGYMPPEQAVGDLAAIDERSDVYSLGAILYELLTAKTPFDGTSSDQRLMQVLNSEPRPIAKLVPDAPPELIAITVKAMARDRADRYASAKQLAEDVERFQSGAIVQAHDYGPRDYATYVWNRYKTSLSFAAVGLITLLTIGVAYTYTVSEGAAREKSLRLETQDALQRAEESGVQARDALAEAETLRERAERGEFVSNIQLANEYLDQKNTTRTREVLAQVPPRFRNWEWGHLLYESSRNLQASTGMTRRQPGPDQTTAQLWDGASPEIVSVLPADPNNGLVYLGVSADGTHAITSGTHPAELWDLTTGTVVQQYPVTGPTFWATANDDYTQVAALQEPNIVVYDAATGETISTLEAGPTEQLRNSGVFGKDGTRLAAPTFPEMSVIVWETDTARRLATIPIDGYRNAEIFYSEFLDDDTKLLISAGNNSFELWDIATETRLRVYQGPRGEEGYFSFEVSPDLRFSTSGRMDESGLPEGGSLVWELESGRLLSERGPAKNGMVSAISADSSTLARCFMDGTVALFEMPSYREMARFENLSESLMWIEFAGTGTRVAVGDYSGGMLRIIAPADRTHTTDILEGHSDLVYNAIYSPDGDRIATASHDGTIVLWDADARSRILALKHDAEIWRLCFSPDGSQLLSESWDRSSRLWDVGTGEELQRRTAGPPSREWLSGPRGYFWRQLGRYASENRFSPDGTRFLVATPDSKVLVIDASSGETLHTLPEHEDFCFNAEYSPRGDRIVTMAGNTLRLWNAESGEEIPWGAEFRLFAFSPDGSCIVTGSSKGSHMIWDATTGSALTEPDGEESNFYWARYSEQGDRILLARTYSTLSIRDGKTGTLMGELSGHTGLIDAYFSPDGTRLLTREEAGVVRVWDHQRGNELVNMQFDNQPLQAAWSPNGSSVIVCDGDVTRIYDSIQSSDLDEIGGDESSLDDRIRLWLRQQA